MKKQDIANPGYWRERIEKAKELHHSIFICDAARWERIENKHRQILANHILFADNVLDAGCGYGRLLGMMPRMWVGGYVGVDISPDLISLSVYDNAFICCDLRNIPLETEPKFDWCVLISIRPMVIRNLGKKEWDKMEMECRRLSKKLLYLEYDETDEGSVE